MEVKIFYFKFAERYILGGDGTVGSVLTYIKNEIIGNSGDSLKIRMPVALLPLGTGNDLSN